MARKNFLSNPRHSLSSARTYAQATHNDEYCCAIYCYPRKPRIGLYCAIATAAIAIAYGVWMTMR